MQANIVNTDAGSGEKWVIERSPSALSNQTRRNLKQGYPRHGYVSKKGRTWLTPSNAKTCLLTNNSCPGLLVKGPQRHYPPFALVSLDCRYHTCLVLDFKKQPPYIFHSRTIPNIQDHHNVRVPDVPYHIASSLRARLEACIASIGQSRHRRRRWPTSCSRCLRRALRKGGVGWIGRYV